MLDICSSFAMSHKLEFNASKTQLICFTAPGVSPTLPFIFFNDVLLTYSEQIIHLGHILSKTLDDSADIMRATRDMNRKANSLIYTFQSIDPFIKTFLLKSYCLSLYGCCIWSLCAPSLRVIEVALNKILRKIWHLPARSHTGIVHCVAKVQTISNLLYHRFHSFISRALSSSSMLIRTIFSNSTHRMYSFTGYNVCNGHLHVRKFTDSELHLGLMIRSLRSFYGLYSPHESLINFSSIH